MKKKSAIERVFGMYYAGMVGKSLLLLTFMRLCSYNPKPSREYLGGTDFGGMYGGYTVITYQ